MKNKNLSTFLYAQILSSFGYNLLDSAITFYVLDLTNSVLKFSVALVSGLIAKAIFYQISGLIADTFDKRKAFFIIDIGYAIIAFLMIILVYTNFINYIFFFVASFLINAIRAISQPISKTIVPTIVDRSYLIKANSYEVSNDKLARIFGPVAALAILSLLGFKAALIVCFVIYILTSYLKSQLIIEVVEKKSISMISFTISFSNRKVLLLLINAMLTQVFIHSFLYTIFPAILHQINANEIIKIFNSNTSIWKSLQAWLRIGGALGVVLSIFAIPRMNINEKQGLNLGVIGLAISSVAIGGIVAYFKTGYISTLLFINLSFIANIFIFFFMNIFTIFFSVFYQKIFDKNELGRFAANYLFLFAVASSIGTYIYGRLGQMSWHYPILFLFVGALLKILTHLVYINCKESHE